MSINEHTKAIDVIVAEMDSKVDELTLLFNRAYELGVDIPQYTVTRANESAVKWWKQNKQQWLKKLVKKQAYEAAIAKLTKEERKVLGL